MNPMHCVSPVGHEHDPPEHVPPAGQVVPQAPQLPLLVCRFTHTIPLPMGPPPMHSVSPVGQPAVHTPLTQVLSGPQRLPHVPQLRGSVSVSVHVPLQLVSPPPHTHAPFVQEAPVPHCVPHAPQSNGSLERSTHALLQLVVPPLHVVVQTPCEQTWPPVHTVAQAPQLFGSLCVSVQTPLQRRPLLKHWHLPPTHVVPDAHRFPQPPQLALSESSSTQVEPHALSPLPHTSVQTLDTQVLLPEQVSLHAPQLSAFEVRSTQTPLQSLWPDGQVQTPPLHVAVAGHVLPQPPQLVVSELSLTHDAPHCVSPAPQVAVQLPFEQTDPVAQTWPHEPQSLGLDEVSTHTSPQSSPCEHEHDPEMHASPAAHAKPHPPQSSGSVVKLTHAPVQSMRPAPQVA